MVNERSRCPTKTISDERGLAWGLTIGGGWGCMTIFRQEEDMVIALANVGEVRYAATSK